MTEAPRTLRLWRVFPWDDSAEHGAPFSSSHIPTAQWSGRFDLGGRPRVLYLGESPAHAIGERLQRYRGQELDWPELREFGWPLALVEVTVSPHSSRPVADLCDPQELLQYGCRPDELMSRAIDRTQRVSRSLYDRGLAGFRVWSALTGDWHSTILFADRVVVGESIDYGQPMELELDSPAVEDAARVLAISIAGR